MDRRAARRAVAAELADFASLSADQVDRRAALAPADRARLRAAFKYYAHMLERRVESEAPPHPDPDQIALEFGDDTP